MMNFKLSEWIGDWINFETLIESEEPALKQVWDEVETAVSSVEPRSPMFAHGARNFWRMACRTQSSLTPVMLKGCTITQKENEVCCQWSDIQGNDLGE